VSAPPTRPGRHRLLRLCGEALLILLLGAGAGLARNALRADPLPYDLPGSTLLTESGARVVFLAEALVRYQAAETIFVDARSRDGFLAGHIDGALCVPLEEAELLLDELDLWSGGQPLLVYDATANLLRADELAHQLRKHLTSEILILAGGFEGWQQRGHPFSDGPVGLLDAADAFEESEEAW